MQNSNVYSLNDEMYSKELIEKECKIQELTNQLQKIQHDKNSCLYLKVLEKLESEQIEYNGLILKHFERRL